MKFLIETTDISSLEQVSHLRVAHDTTRKIVALGNYTPTPSIVHVLIDDADTEFDPTQTYAEQGQWSLYTQNSYAEGESSDDYFVDGENTYPQEGDTYYTYCNEVINVTVYIDGTQAVLDSNRTFAQQGYTTMYDATSDMYKTEYPSEDGKYSTDYITIYVDGTDEESNKIMVSSHYTFADQSKTGYLKVGDYGTIAEPKCLDNVKPIKNEKYTTNTVMTYVDGDNILLSSYYTFADQDYNTMYDANNYMSEIDCSTEMPYDNINYSSSKITVVIDGTNTDVSEYYDFYGQNYAEIYDVNNSMSDCREDKPSSGKKYSTVCVTVYIDNVSKEISSTYSFSKQGYDIMYDVTNSMNDCVDENPQENIEYSTSRITVTIDGEEKYMSPHYIFPHQGYETIYMIDKSTHELGQQGEIIPSSSEKYSSDYITVTIDGADKQMSLYYAFADYAYTTMYDVNDSMNACIDSNPQDGGKYSSDYITVTINGEEKTLSSHYTFAEQGYDGTLYGKGDCDSEYYELDPSIAYPQEYIRYLTESKITVTIDTESVEVFPSITFREQGYADIYKEVEGEDIDCADENPEEGGEYWTT